MGQPAAKKGKWVLSFESKLKKLAITTAKRKGISPVILLENLVREKFNPCGHTDVDDSTAYVTALRKQSRKQSDEAFLAEIDAWQKSRSS